MTSANPVTRDYNQVEIVYRDKLADLKGGVTEIPVYYPGNPRTLIGKIDVLTSSELWEVKHYKRWKFAIGQVLAYGSVLPTLTKCLFLWGFPKDRKLQEQQMINETCKSLGIRVYWG